MDASRFLCRGQKTTLNHLAVRSPPQLHPPPGTRRGRAAHPGSRLWREAETETDAEDAGRRAGERRVSGGKRQQRLCPSPGHNPSLLPRGTSVPVRKDALGTPELGQISDKADS